MSLWPPLRVCGLGLRASPRGADAKPVEMPESLRRRSMDGGGSATRISPNDEPRVFDFPVQATARYAKYQRFTVEAVGDGVRLREDGAPQP